MSARRPLTLVLVLAAALVLVGGAQTSAAPSPPSIDDFPPNPTRSTTAHFAFSSAEAPASYVCALDGAEPAGCTSPVDYASLSEGEHTFAVRASDAEGGESAPATYTWRVDLTSPQLSLSSPDDGLVTNDGTPEFGGTGGTADGDGASVTVVLRQGSATTGRPYETLTAAVNPESGVWSVAPALALAAGAYTVRVEQTDTAGNVTETAARSFTIDLTPPPTPSLSGPRAWTRSTSAQLAFSSSEEGVAFRCRLDGGSFSPCASPLSVGGLDEGLHTFAVTATDAAGNESAPATHAWKVDTTAPNVSVSSPTDGSFTNDGTPLFRGTGGTAAGDGDTVKVRVREGSETSGRPYLTLTAAVNSASGAWSVAPAERLPAGPYTVRAEQEDAAGNAAETAPTGFTIDFSVPSVTLVQPRNGFASEQRSPSFSGTADAGTVVVELHEGSAADGAAFWEHDLRHSGGAWSATYDGALADGVYTAVAEVTNAAGTTGTSQATTFAVDGAAPVFTSVPANQTFEQSARAGEVFAFAVAAGDAVDPEPQVSCSPRSGTTFPLGSTRVTCTARDWAGHAAQTSFVVRVVNTIRPAPVGGFRARARDDSVRLTWQRPADWDYARVVIARARRGSTSWRVILRTRRATAFTDRRVRNDHEYLYRARSVDIAGRTSAPGTLLARPSAFFSPAWAASLSAPVRLRWTAVRTASYYNVQVWHKGRKVLSRWPERARYRLSSTWTFNGRRRELGPGKYYAYAWPGFGRKEAARYGRVIGWTMFVVR